MKLSADQLAQVEAFIRRRGFSDVVVVHEVLDHVACRVEEKLIQVPTVALPIDVSNHLSA